MQHQKVYRFLMVLVLLVASSLSCELFSFSIEKEVEKIEETAGAVITEVELEGIETEVGSILTEVGNENIIEGIEGLVTELPQIGGEAPEDIPIIEGSTDLVASKTFVTYSTDKDFKTVIEFYNTEMLKLDWTKVENESKQETDTATLVFTKGTRKATIEITDFFMLLVTITITE